jgi:hypothetical protein
VFFFTNKIMTYTRDTLYRKKTLIEEQTISQNLFNRLINSEKLTVAEGRYICGRLELLRSDDPNAVPLNGLDYPQCVNCIFMDKYVTYFKNFEGWDYQEGPFGEIPKAQKIADISFLNDQYLLWKTNVVENLRLKDELLRHVQIETYRQLKTLKEYCKEVGYGSNRFKHLAKGLILNSKFTYITALEYYEDGNVKEQSIDICNHKIVVDSYAYVHILFRHYAAQVKEHLQDKSYHNLGDFDYKQIPKEIFSFLTQFSAVADCNSFDEEKVFFRFNGNLYALWWKKTPRQLKGLPKETIFRVETLYPVEAQRDLDKIAQKTEINITNTLSIFR